MNNNKFFAFLFKTTIITNTLDISLHSKHSYDAVLDGNFGLSICKLRIRLWYLVQGRCLDFKSSFLSPCVGFIKKQPSRCVLRNRCSENMEQIYRRKPMPKCDFNKLSLRLYWNHTSAWVFSCKSVAYLQNTFSWTPLEGYFWFIRVRQNDFFKVITQEQQATAKPIIYLCMVCMCLCVCLNFFNYIGAVLRI